MKKGKGESSGSSGMTKTGLASINEDLLQKILERLPAPSFASASCVSKSWNRTTHRVLSRPKFSSALSLNPSPLVALAEVVEKVLSEPIRPDFALAHVVGLGFDLNMTLNFLGERLGWGTPIVVTCANGIMGTNVSTHEYMEFTRGHGVDGEEAEAEDGNLGVVLTVGFLPGLKVGVIPLLRRKRATKKSTIEQFVMDVKNYSAAASGSVSPIVIMMFGDSAVDQKPIIEELDNAMSKETIIIGDERAQFVYRSGNESNNVCMPAKCASDAVALVLARDRNRPYGIGEIQFHAELSSGLLPIGPMYKAVSVRVSGLDHRTWLTAKRDGQQEILDGNSILQDINNELENRVGCPELYIGVTRRRKRFIRSEKSRLSTFLVYHGVLGGDEEHLFVDGSGFNTGDYFQFYHSDPNFALSSCNDVSANIRNLKLDWNSKSSIHSRDTANNVRKEFLGGFVFSCCGRGKAFFGHDNIDSSPFLENFTGAPLAGVFCCGEIGRGFPTGNPGHCCLHFYSSVYLAVSYEPAFVES